MNDRTAETALATPAAFESTTSMMPIAFIAPSLTNPRKTKNEETFKEFVANIAKVGILQPVLVRPMPATRTDAAAKGKTHELVFGHRRLAGAIAAGLQNIPVNLRELTDLEVLEIQIIENLQREDVHPLEEAEGYERLMQQINPTTKAKYTAEEIGARIGKSRRYVYNRLKLLDLCPEARKSFYDGEIDSSKAYLLARIGHHDTQRQALKQVFLRPYNPPSYRVASEEIERLYMLDLKNASFDIKLVDYRDAKGKLIAGACNSCPKRSGNSPDLFGDIKSANTCTDIKCFHAKREAASRMKLDELQKKGVEVIAGKDAKNIFASTYSPHSPSYESGFVDKSHTMWDANLADKARGKPLDKLLGKDLPVTFAQSPHDGQVVEIVDKKAAMKLLREKGLVIAPSKSTSKTNPGADAHRKDKYEFERQGRIDSWNQARGKFANGLSETEWRFMAKYAAEMACVDMDPECFDELVGLYGINVGDDAASPDVMKLVSPMIEKMPVAQIPRLLFELQHYENIVEGMGTNEAIAWLKDLFKRCDVSLDDNIAAARKAAKEKEAADKKEAAEKAKAEKSAKAPAAKTPAKKK